MVTGHAYPWDVLGDPAFPDRAPEAVTLAAAYHSCRAATPLHPGRQLVDARYAAFYRPIRDAAWTGRDLRPLGPDWLDEKDPYGEAAAILSRTGRRVNAWIVLTHNTRLGTQRPDVAVVNCFGEAYPYALCPAHAEVRDYAATLAAEAVRDAPVDGISLEACGQLGVNHLGHHEKTEGAWSADTATLLSICCCAACQAGWRADGHSPARVIAALRQAVLADGRGCAAGAGIPLPIGKPSRAACLAEAEPAEAEPAEAQRTEAQLAEAVVAGLLANRHANTDALRAQVLEALRAEAPGIPITLHAHPDAWVTGPSPGLTPTAEDDVDALLVPAWPTTEASADLVRRAATTGLPIDAYVTVLPPAGPDQLVPHVQRLKAAGATRFSLYHLGLAPRGRQDLFATIAAAIA
jgi:hypothetical protein